MLKVLGSLMLFIACTAYAGEVTRFGRAFKEALPTEDLKVLVWNIHKGEDQGFEADYQDLTEGKHLVLMQEANLTDELKAQLLTRKLGYTHGKSFNGPLSGVKMGVATGSTVVSTYNEALVSPVRELRSTSTKATLIQKYKLANMTQQLMVVNVHAINFVPNTDFVTHIRQIALSISTHKGPLLVGGDFNTWNVDRLNYLDQIFSALDLKRVKFSPGRTRFPDIGYLFGSRTGGELDQVYLRGLTLKEQRVHTYIETSDHKPLELTLSVN